MIQTRRFTLNPNTKVKPTPTGGSTITASMTGRQSNSVVIIADFDLTGKRTVMATQIGNSNKWKAKRS